MNEPPDEFLTVDEVTAWLKVNRKWLYDLVQAGQIPHVKLARRHLRFRRAEIEKWLKDRSR